MRNRGKNITTSPAASALTNNPQNNGQSLWWPEFELKGPADINDCDVASNILPKKDYEAKKRDQLAEERNQLAEEVQTSGLGLSKKDVKEIKSEVQSVLL